MDRARYTKALRFASCLALITLGAIAACRVSVLANANAMVSQPTHLNVSQTGPAVPTGVSAHRTGPENVHVTWSSSGANTKHFYVFHVASPGTPPDDWRSGGWQNDSILGASQRQVDLPVTAVKPPLHNFYLVCPSNNTGDYSCSAVVKER